MEEQSVRENSRYGGTVSKARIVAMEEQAVRENSRYGRTVSKGE